MQNLCVVILAGGLGKRMESPIPKVCHYVKDKPMIVHVIETAKSLNPEKIFVVSGIYSPFIEDKLMSFHLNDDVEFIIQPEALGTGNAIQSAIPQLSKYKSYKTLILSGDVPLIGKQTLIDLVNMPGNCSLLSHHCSHPKGYGRIVMDDKNNFSKIVEEKDCSESEKLIEVVNTGIYCIRNDLIVKYAPYINNTNAQQEYYLTDLPFLIKTGELIDIDVSLLPAENSIEVKGINTKAELNELNVLLSKHI